MLEVTPDISIAESEIDISAVRAGGAGGQNVNKVSSAAHLRFDIQSSHLPDWLKARLLELRDRRVSSDGVLIIKAQRFRTLEKNTEDARQRLLDLVRRAAAPRKRRVATRPPRSAREKRLKEKTRRGETKKLRGKVI